VKKKMAEENLDILSDEQTTRDKILFLLKTRGPMTVKALSEILGVTPMGIRRHLTTLELENLVKHRQEHKPVGRPTYYCELTREAEKLFPKHYDTLALHILESVEEKYGEESVEEVAQTALRKELAGISEALGQKKGHKRVRALVDFLNEHGFMSTWRETEPGVFEISQYNCPFLTVSLRFPVLCNPMQSMLTDLFPGAEISVRSVCTEGTSGLYRIVMKREEEG